MRRECGRTDGGGAAGRLAACLVAALVATGVAGCSAVAPRPAPPPSISPSSAPSVPYGSTSLRDLNFTHAPSGFAIPSDTPVIAGVNLKAVITAQFNVSDGPEVLSFLLVHLPGMGYEITGSSDDSVVFQGAVWHGAFTMSATTAMLTLRYEDQ